MSEIKPALTEEEWANWKSGVERGDHGRDVLITLHKMAPYRALSVEGADYGGVAWVHQDGLHTTAALCLHNQPFGFTREDVEALGYKGVGYDEGHDQEQLDDIAMRIEALLPPEKS